MRKAASGKKCNAGRLLAACVLACLAGCASHDNSGALDLDALGNQQAEDGSSVDRAMALLNVGKETMARAMLVDYLAAHPKSATAKRLLAQIDTAPETLLGRDFQDYTVERGDTMSELASRFANDSLLFYALARHNGFKSPKEMRAGAVIEVPRAKDASVTITSGKSDIVWPPPAMISAKDREETEKLRLLALTKLNAGDAQSAVSLLRDAEKRIPGDPAILDDLARAERILRTVELRPNR